MPMECGAGWGRRWIRVATGASLRMQRAGGRPWEATLSLVAACSAASGGLGGVEVECSLPYSSSCLSEFLRALVPPGAAACPALRSIELRDDGLLPHSPPLSLESLLGGGPREPLSFPNLEILSLPNYCPVNQLDAVAAVDQLPPRLKRLEIALEDFKDAAAVGLAGLFALESLEVHLASGERPPRPEQDAAPLLEALASGPAARSLKELRCNARPCHPTLSAAALRAIPLLPALERLRGRLLLSEEVGEEGLAALGSHPALRSLGTLLLYSSEGLPRQLAGLAAALERSPILADLDVRLSDLAFQQEEQEEIGALARLARASRGRLSLELHIFLDNGWPAAAAAALAANPLRRLALEVFADDEDLRGGLLDDLSAFAGCSAGDFEVNVRLLRRVVNADAAQAALARALPAARVFIRHRRS
eukprot:tig00000786_g4061.t1